MESIGMDRTSLPKPFYQSNEAQGNSKQPVIAPRLASNFQQLKKKEMIKPSRYSTQYTVMHPYSLRKPYIIISDIITISRTISRLMHDQSHVQRSKKSQKAILLSSIKTLGGPKIIELKVFYLFRENRIKNGSLFVDIESYIRENYQFNYYFCNVVVFWTLLCLNSINERDVISTSLVSVIYLFFSEVDVDFKMYPDNIKPQEVTFLRESLSGWIAVVGKVAEIKTVFCNKAPHYALTLKIMWSIKVALAQMEYQLPRLTRMWTHLERQAGGRVKGMGEKQIEVDKRILRTQIGVLKKELESVRKHRKQYRNRRTSVPVPVVSLVGYTNAGKSTLLNQLTGADVLAEDRLFATLDPTTKRVQIKNGNEFLLTDTVGFIQKLPTTLVAAFRATLEEISESSLLVHVVDISHPLVEQQVHAVDKVLSELDVSSIPRLMVWNKVDRVSDPKKLKLEAERKQDVVCVSALNGDGLQEFCNAVQEKLKDSMVWVEALVPFDKGELLSTIHQVGMVERTEYTESGTLIKAHVPLRFARLLTPMRQLCTS
ncbi:hypothetical protein SADUNF_Sadunf02G0025500 [Salix dunnii]|uniref:Hflx-type G domain-containing protein n=1 Tax=Salix dunnii TaxID=1413687 RepID=A0A835N5Q2_9ROSI|nr:hypothetical protein SADUNF_Sadunf02G0025500 [Salix dunnii]